MVKPFLSCHCGSNQFEPLGIQEGWPGREAGAAPRVLFLVNCVKCGTTLACHRLNYALLRIDQARRTLTNSFYRDTATA